MVLRTICAVITGIPKSTKKGGKMAKNFYTLLIIPQHGSPTRKISLSPVVIKGALLFFLFFVRAFVYSFYDYMSLKSDRLELALLRKETQEQQKQIEGLAAQSTVFSQRMEYLKQLRLIMAMESPRALVIFPVLR
jgi:hypothetical protein